MDYEVAVSEYQTEGLLQFFLIFVNFLPTSGSIHSYLHRKCEFQVWKPRTDDSHLNFYQYYYTNWHESEHQRKKKKRGN